jgi:predicted secreted protein
MILNHSNLNALRNPRLAGIVLALAAILAGAAFLSAQPRDTPIVIGDGSLTMESAVPWSSFTGTGTSHGHPNAGKSITSVDVTMPALNQTVTFNAEKAEIDVTYADTFGIKVSSGAGGKRLTVNTDFSAFHAGVDSNHLSHNNATGSITHVTIVRNGTVALDSAASGHTKVVIHYQ